MDPEILVLFDANYFLLQSNSIIIFLFIVFLNEISFGSICLYHHQLWFRILAAQSFLLKSFMLYLPPSTMTITMAGTSSSRITI